MSVFFSFVNVSSTNLSHISGGVANDARAYFSKLPMKMFAAKPDVAAPMARPSTWV